MRIPVWWTAVLTHGGSATLASRRHECLCFSHSVSQNLEGVIPLAAEETWKAPKHANRFQGAGGNDSATMF